MDITSRRLSARKSILFNLYIILYYIILYYIILYYIILYYINYEISQETFFYVKL